MRPGEWRVRAALIGLSLCSGVAFQAPSSGGTPKNFHAGLISHGQDALTFWISFRTSKLDSFQVCGFLSPKSVDSLGTDSCLRLRQALSNRMSFESTEVRTCGWFPARLTSSTCCKSQANMGPNLEAAKSQNMKKHCQKTLNQRRRSPGPGCAHFAGSELASKGLRHSAPHSRPLQTRRSCCWTQHMARGCLRGSRPFHAVCICFPCCRCLLLKTLEYWFEALDSLAKQHQHTGN